MIEKCKYDNTNTDGWCGVWLCQMVDVVVAKFPIQYRAFTVKPTLSPVQMGDNHSSLLVDNLKLSHLTDDG